MIAAGKIIDKQLSRELIYEYKIMSSSGQIYYPAYTMGGGGSAKNFVNTPYEVGADVLFTTVRSANFAPYFIIGGLQDPSDQEQINVEVPAGDTVSSINAGDYAIRLGGSAVVLTEGGRVAVAGSSVNLQLNGGSLRVSQTGVADNQLLNAQNTIDTLVSYIDQLNLKIAALEAAVSSAAPAVAAAYTAAAAAATAAGNVVLAAQLAQQQSESSAAVAALQASPALPTGASIDASLTSGVNPHIKVP